MEGEFYAFYETNNLTLYAKTSKKLLPSLENINILNKEEYNNIIFHYIEYLFASNIPIRITGACYLKLIYENDTRRFKDNIFNILEQSSFSLDDIDDYSDMEYIFIICDLELYKDFLRFIIEKSSNTEIKTEAIRNLSISANYYENSLWYETYIKEYIHFKNHLCF